MAHASKHVLRFMQDNWDIVLTVLTKLECYTPIKKQGF